MKKTIQLFAVITLFSSTSIFSQIKVETNGDIKVGDESAKILVDNNGRYGEASNFTFNTSKDGFLFEQGLTESAGFYADGDYAVIWSPGDQGRLLRVYDEDGMNERWYLDGSGNAYTVSDERKKENIKDMPSMLQKLIKIRTVTYNYKINKGEEKKDSGVKKTYCGFLAQNLGEMIPELVDTDENGNKFVNYNGMISVLLSALKEQQEVIEKQENRLKAIEDKLGL